MRRFFPLPPLFLISFTLIAVLSTQGCSLTVWRPNSAIEVPRQSLAILTADCFVSVTSIDDEAIKLIGGACWSEKARVFGGYEYHLDPGRHIIKVSYGSTDGYSTTSSKEDLTLKFHALSGHTYHINSGRSGQTWRPHIVDITK